MEQFMNLSERELYRIEKVKEKCTIDIMGKSFGKLKVIKFSNRKGNRGEIYYTCECECGNTLDILGISLRSGNTTSCGCNGIINLIGQKFGKWSVISFQYIKNNSAYWMCKCDCGNEKVVNGHSLRRGRSKSCGCLDIEMGINGGTFKKGNGLIDLSGKRFGKLKVIKIDKNHIKPNGKEEVVWLCLCDCGKTVSVMGQSLRSGNTKSCGCLSESWIAFEVKKYCLENYNAISEYKILKNPKTNHYLPYDVYLPEENIFIEVNGEQHYRETSWLHEKFWDRKQRDKLKKQYAKKNGTFIEIDLRKIKTVEQAIEKIEKVIERKRV